MIKRLSLIKKFGIYVDFKWNSDTTRDFNDKNIIYGWNYSGKTTLSRLFRLLSKKTKFQIEEDADFSIRLEDKNDLTRSNYLDCNIDIIVFNNDFICENLHFESFDTRFKGILFDIGVESVETREKVREIETEIGNINALLANNHQHLDKFTEFEVLFTTESKKIKNENFGGAIEFNKGHFKRIIDTFSPNSFQSFIIDADELSELRSNALAKNTLPRIEEKLPIVHFQSLINDTEACLGSEPTLSEDEDILTNNPDLYDWGEKGLEIYTKHPDIQRCAFCGGSLADERRRLLNEYYNNEAARLKKRISNLIKRIEDEMVSIGNTFCIRLTPNNFMECCRMEFNNLMGSFVQIKADYIKQLEVCREALINKLNNFLFIALSLPDVDKSVEQSLIDWLSQLQSLIIKHNETVSNFLFIKTNSIERYKKHLVSSFLFQSKYYVIKSQKERQEKENQKYEALLLSKKQEREKLLAKLRSVVKGQERLNHYIQIFLNREDISVEVADDEFFVLKRGEEIARNLSEGEKTAIAFSYFLVMLESLHQDGELQKYIVFIDDPISSLDANHIAQVASLVNSFFFRKDSTGKIINCFKQLFISTHSFEFYAFLRDSNNIKRKKKIINNGRKEEHASCHFYMLKRVSERSTQLLDLPKSFSCYNSEYIYLFEEIYTYKEEYYPESKAYVMPNIIRRFLEIYTLIKLPGNRDEIDNRVKLLMGDINELKLLHYFSHFTTPERISKHSELILRVPDLVDDVLTLLKKDPIHFKSLLEGVNRNDIQ